MFLCPLMVVAVLNTQALDPSFEIDSTGEHLLVGPIETLATDGKLLLADRMEVAAGQLVSIRQLSRPRPPFPSGASVTFHNGDEIAGAAVQLQGALVSFRAPLLQRYLDDKPGGNLQIPLTAIARLQFRKCPPLDPDRYAGFLSASRREDQVLLRNGDLLTGTLTALDTARNQVQVESGAETRTIAADKVIAIAFSTRLARSRRPSGSYARLVLSDGTRLTVTNTAIKDGRLTAATAFRESVQAALEDVAAVDIHQGPAVFLSDLKPLEYAYRSYNGEAFPLGVDRTFDGKHLQLQTPLGPQTFDKGLSMHGSSTATYDLEGRYSRFECVVGLDARLGKRGGVQLRILVDGKEQEPRDKELTLENGPRRIKLNVSGGKRLTLRVDWGDGGNVNDYVDWCDARLVK